MIENVAALIDEYLKHRAEREQQIVAALESGPLTIDQLVERIYSGLHPSVVRAAADSVLAHLLKLREENRAATTPDCRCT